MKLRILDNYLRIRLSQTNVDQLEKEGKIETETDFGSSVLKYSLSSDDIATDVTANYVDNKITITIPASVMNNWLDPEEVGMENKDQSKLRILIEKDFECLHKRPGDDDKDSFPNPMA